MKIFKLIACLATALLINSTPIVAQNGTLTPYSRYGYGILNDNTTSAQRAMGGVGYAMNSGRQINVKNPASYAMCDSLTFLFDMGLDFTTMWQNETHEGQKLSNKQNGGGLEYITMQFPITKYLGASVGILPYSSVGYAFGGEIENGSTSRQGSGSINQLYAGLGAKIYKGLTFGVNVAYLFGTTYNDTYAYSTSSTLFERKLEVTDWRMDLGLQYNLPISRKNSATIGLVYSPAKDLHGTAYTSSYDLSQDTDPTTNEMRLAGNYSIAETWGAGVAWHWDQRLLAEFDFTYQPWSKTKFAGEKQNTADSQLTDKYKGAVGLQFTPKTRGSYLQSVQYRAGAFYSRDYLHILGNNVREYGASIGLGLPVPTFKTIVSLGLEWRHRQAYPAALIKENYLCLTLGVNFNEMWFRKSKIY